jgi:hypothetical protein
MAAVENELTDFSKITRAQLQSTGCRRYTVGISRPPHVRDAERAEQHFAGKLLDRLSARLCHDSAQQLGATAAVVPFSSRSSDDPRLQGEAPSPNWR